MRGEMPSKHITQENPFATRYELISYPTEIYYIS